MSEPTKALLVVLGIIFIPFVVYFCYHALKDYYQTKNVIQVDFKKENGKIKGYIKDKKGKWVYDETLTLEDSDDLIDDTHESHT